MDNKPKYKIVLDELWAKGVVILETQDQPLRVASAQEQGEPCRSGRVVWQPSHFMVWDSLLTKVPEEPEMVPWNYYEAIQDKDVTLWQKVIKINMESLYSNQVWFLVKTTWWGKTHRFTSGSTREKEW